jgi:DNA-binding Lrp family transcriptional regulator
MDSVRESGNASGGREAAARWTFFSNHFLVLVSVAGDPDLRVRDIADRVGITERATQAILSDLVADGYVERSRIGRRNRYKIRRGAGFRHPLTTGTTVGEVIDVVVGHYAERAVG